MVSGEVDANELREIGANAVWALSSCKPACSERVFVLLLGTACESNNFNVVDNIRASVSSSSGTTILRRTGSMLTKPNARFRSSRTVSLVAVANRSDGPQPHAVNVQFLKRQEVQVRFVRTVTGKCTS
jgi:hypothetical protein